MAASYTLTIPSIRQRKVPIHVGTGALADIPKVLAKLKEVDNIVILYDARIEGIAAKVLEQIGTANMIALPTGEQSKSLKQVERILEDMLLKNASKKSVMICVGGGTVTDVGGFVSSVFMRGIRIIQVPTTLMAMADAAIGGRTAINLGMLKNIIGTHRHPEAVIIDTEILGALQDEHLRGGLVEVVKMAAMADAEFFGWLEENIYRIIDREGDTLENCLKNAIRLRIDAFEQGAKNRDYKDYLRFGHTVGHAVEALSHFSVSHGHAVSMGMAVEMRAADTDGSERVLKLLDMLDTPTSIPTEIDSRQIWEVMENDKQTVGGTVFVAAPKSIGEGQILSMSKERFYEVCP